MEGGEGKEGVDVQEGLICLVMDEWDEWDDWECGGRSRSLLFGDVVCDYIYPHLSIWSHLTSSHAKNLFCWSLRYAYVGYEVDVK